MSSSPAHTIIIINRLKSVDHAIELSIFTWIITFVLSSLSSRLASAPRYDKTGQTRSMNKVVHHLLPHLKMATAERLSMKFAIAKSTRLATAVFGYFWGEIWYKLAWDQHKFVTNC